MVEFVKYYGRILWIFPGHNNNKKKKRLAPSPPLSKSSEEDFEEVLEHKSHEALGAKLSASLRATFARNSQS